jgi:hypothetical protein
MHYGHHQANLGWVQQLVLVFIKLEEQSAIKRQMLWSQEAE